MYFYIYVCMYISIYIYIYMHVYMYICIHAYIHTYTYWAFTLGVRGLRVFKSGGAREPAFHSWLKVLDDGVHSLW